MQTMNYAPYVGGLLVIVAVVGFATGIIPSTDDTTLLAIGLGVLGIHNTVTNLGKSR